MDIKKKKKSGLPEWMGNLRPPDKRPCLLKGRILKKQSTGKAAGRNHHRICRY